MIELIVLNYLNSKLDAPCHMEEQNLAEYCTIEKLGSSVENHIKSAMIAVQSYGTSLYNACELNSKVIAAMNDIIEIKNVSSCKLNTDYNHTDITTKNIDIKLYLISLIWRYKKCLTQQKLAQESLK